MAGSDLGARPQAQTNVLNVGLDLSLTTLLILNFESQYEVMELKSTMRNEMTEMTMTMMGALQPETLSIIMHAISMTARANVLSVL